MVAETMATNDSNPGYRTASELVDPPATALVPNGSESIRVCGACWAWTGHERQEDGSYSCIPCEKKDVPECDRCDRSASTVIDGTPLCGIHGLARAEGEN